MGPEGYSDRQWARIVRWRRRGEFWIHYPAPVNAGNEALRVCDRSGYDFAVLYWQICHVCRHGHIGKISIAPERQRQRYGTRMVLRAMRGCESYTWTTTGQSPDAQRFFPVLAAATGAAFTARGRTCRHIHPMNPSAGTPRLIRDPGTE